MLLGVCTAFVAVVVSLVADPAISSTVVSFAGGALFGKGYGLWEERARRKESR